MLIIIIQVYLAILFAQFIGEHPQVVVLLREIGCGIFTLLTVYFLAIAKTPQKIKGKIKKQRTSTRFFLGMLLSTLNFLPIPFYAFASMTLATSGYFSFDKIPVAEFVIGVMSGSFTVLYIYIVAFKKIENKTEFLMRNINTIIGSVTTFMAVLTLFKLLYK